MKGPGVLWIVVPAARTSTPSSASLRGAHIAIRTMLDVGTMFRLQKNISLVEPRASHFDNRGQGEAAFAIGSVT